MKSSLGDAVQRLPGHKRPAAAQLLGMGEKVGESWRMQDGKMPALANLCRGLPHGFAFLGF